MPAELTPLRLLGIVAGLGGAIASFLYFRGLRWNRFNFVVSSAGSLALLLVSLEPDLLLALRRALQLGDFEGGALIGLLILSSLFLLVLSFYTRGQVDRQRILIDRLVRGLVAEEALEAEDCAERLKTITVIVPAYDEAENLQVLLPQIPRRIEGIEVGVLVVDDGSSDRTAAVAREHGALAIRSPINRGQGAAIRIGIELLGRLGIEYGVTIDADNQHRPEDIAAVLAPVLRDELDLAIGSRILGTHEAGVGVRSAGIALLTRLINLLIGNRLTDCSSGFKAFRVSRLRGIPFVEEQFQAAEFIILCAKHGLRIGEVPIHIRARHAGSSKKGTDLTYGLRFTRTILRSWWR